MKLAIILTNDWELFGNGQGDYFINQKEPLNSILEVIEFYQAKLTVFAEVVQQLNILKQASSDERSKAIASDWEETVSELVQQGHDVQLHIHPQLIDNKISDHTKWSIANFQRLEMFNIISECKNYIEKTISNSNKDYKCLAFRAGYFANQPSNIVIENLLKAGIKCDTSVTKGLFGGFYDFRNSYSHYFPWFCKSNICLRDNEKGALLEIPIYSIPKLDSPFLRAVFPAFYYRLFHSTRLSKEEKCWLKEDKIKGSGYTNKESYSAQFKYSSRRFIFSKLITNSSIQFDYDQIPARILVRFIKGKWNEINNSNIKKDVQFDKCYLPVVLIGHAKNLKSTYNIEQFLKLLTPAFSDSYEFFTISSYYNQFLSNLSIYDRLDNHLRLNGLI